MVAMLDGAMQVTSFKFPESFAILTKVVYKLSATCKKMLKCASKRDFTLNNVYLMRGKFQHTFRALLIKQYGCFVQNQWNWIKPRREIVVNNVLFFC